MGGVDGTSSSDIHGIDDRSRWPDAAGRLPALLESLGGPLQSKRRELGVAGCVADHMPFAFGLEGEEVVAAPLELRQHDLTGAQNRGRDPA